jgi:hypothetical protein
LTVVVADETALATAATCRGTAVGLHISVPDKPTLSYSAARACTTLRLKVWVLDEATLCALCVDKADENCAEYSKRSKQ